MQALKLLGQQLTKIWHQLGLNQKVIVIVSGLLVLAGLGGLVYWSARPDFAVLYSDGLEQIEISQIISELDSKNIKYTQVGSSIRVPRDKVYSVRAQLQLKGIPKAGSMGYELLDGQKFGETESMYAQNKLRALAGELEKTIKEFEGIQAARVFLVSPDRTLMLTDNKKPTASVMLTLRGLSQLDLRTVAAVRSLVAGAVQGLKPNDVTVTDNSGALLAEPQEEGSMASLSGTHLAAQVSAEKYLTGRLQQLLDTVYGAKQVVVQVSVKVDNETFSMTDQIYHKDMAAKKSEILSTERNNSNTPKPGGVPGTDPNSDTKTTNGPAFTFETTESGSTNGQVEYAPSLSTTNISRPPGSFKNIRATVFINTNSNPNINIPELKQSIVNAIGIEVGNNPTVEGAKPDIAEVAINTVSFNTSLQTTIAAQVSQEQRTEWLWKIGRGSLYALVGLAALILFWRLVRSSSEELLPTGIPVGQLVGGQLVYEAPSGGGGGMGFPSGMVQSMTEQRVEEVVSADQDVEELQAAKSKLVMDFGLGQAAPERITIEVLKQLIRENPAKMGQAARVWLQRKSADE